MSQTQPQIQVKHDVPIEARLEQVQKLLEQMGIRNVEPAAATAAQVKRMCVEVEKRRAAEGYVRKMEEVMSFAGASPYVVFAFQTQQGVVCIPDDNFVVDVNGVYYVHKIDCRGDSLKCAQVADKVVDLLGIRRLVSSATFLAIHPSEQELCELGILPPTACRKKEKEKEEKTEEEEEEKEEEEGKKTSITQEELEPLESVALKKLTEELMRAQRHTAEEQKPKDPKAALKELGLGWLAELSEADVAALRSVAEDKTLLNTIKDAEKRNAVRKFIESGFAVSQPAAPAPPNIAKWPQKDVELFAKLAEGTRSFHELVAKYLEAEFGCDVEIVYKMLKDLVQQAGGCERLQRIRSRLIT
jgi:hypothetical protein